MFLFFFISRSLLQIKTWKSNPKVCFFSLHTLTKAGAASARCIDTRAKGNSKVCKDCKRCGREQWLQSSFAAPPWDQSCWDNGGNRGTNHHFELLQAFSDHHLTVARWCLHIRVAKAEDEVNEPMEANHNCRRWTSWCCSSLSSSLFTIVKLRTQRRGQTHALLVTYQSIQREAIRG